MGDIFDPAHDFRPGDKFVLWDVVYTFKEYSPDGQWVRAGQGFMSFMLDAFTVPGANFQVISRRGD